MIYSLMNIGCLQIDFKFADLTDIESVYIPKSAWPIFAKQVHEESPIFEMVILATCNRFEIYFVSQDHEQARDWIIQSISQLKELSTTHIREKMRFMHGQTALTHLFRVSAGMESMVFGEDEILSQIKSAYTDFQALGLTKALFNKVFQTAIAAGKRARHETEISRGAYSVSSIAVDAIRELRLDYFGASILIIGAGTIAMRALKKLHALGHPSITMCNRTDSKLKSLQERYQIQALPFASLETDVSRFDIILIATASTAYLLKPAFFKTDTDSEQLILDLCVPRNVDPDVAKLTHIQLLTVDSLQKIADKNVNKRQKEHTKVTLILDDEMTKIDQWIAHRMIHNVS
jgi:glutamyl-tRNA reductase